MILYNIGKPLFKVALGLFCMAFCTALAADQKALVGGRLIDGFGARPIADSVILVNGDTIEQVGTVDTLPVPDGYEVISTEGMDVLPGLWESHAHLMITGHATVESAIEGMKLGAFDYIQKPFEIEQLKHRGIGVVITEHKVRETLEICDRAYIIKDGVILREGNPEDIAADPRVRLRIEGTLYDLTAERVTDDEEIRAFARAWIGREIHQ